MFNPDKYVSDNSYKIDLLDYSPIGEKIRCIDDRSSRSEDKSRDIAIPGSGFGVVVDIFGALTLLRRQGKNVIVDSGEIFSAVKKVLGVITFHTDRKSVENGGLICGGCGHLSGGFSLPEKYLISESDVKFLIEVSLPEADRLLKEQNIFVPVYEGKHNAEAVFSIESFDVGLPSASVSGEQVYVYHHGYHQMILKKIASEIFSIISRQQSGFTLDEINSYVLKSAADRLSVTLGKLAHDLPKFSVARKDKICVEKV